MSASAVENNANHQHMLRRCAVSVLCGSGGAHRVNAITITSSRLPQPGLGALMTEILCNKLGSWNSEDAGIYQTGRVLQKTLPSCIMGTVGPSVFRA